MELHKDDQMGLGYPECLPYVRSTDIGCPINSIHYLPTHPVQNLLSSSSWQQTQQYPVIYVLSDLRVKASSGSRLFPAISIGLDSSIIGNGEKQVKGQRCMFVHSLHACFSDFIELIKPLE